MVYGRFKDFSGNMFQDNWKFLQTRVVRAPLQSSQLMMGMAVAMVYALKSVENNAVMVSVDEVMSRHRLRFNLLVWLHK